MSAAGNITHPKNLTAWHALPANEVLRLLDSNPQSGLPGGEVARRLEKYGHNQLPEARKQGPFARLLKQLNNILVYVLLAAGFVKLMAGLWLDAAIILAVVVINALLGFIQEGKAEKALDSIRKMLSREARTLRESQTRLVPSEGLVPGERNWDESTR
jgi:magnesium-transporting ATPase (P-type)